MITIPSLGHSLQLLAAPLREISDKVRMHCYGFKLLDIVHYGCGAFFEHLWFRTPQPAIQTASSVGAYGFYIISCTRRVASVRPGADEKYVLNGDLSGEKRVSRYIL